MELQKLHHLPPPITSKTLVTLVAKPQLLHTCAPMADITFQSAAPHTYQPWNQFLSTIQSMNQALQQDRYSNQQPSVYHQSPPPNPTHQNFNQPVLNSSIPNLEKLDEVDEWIGASLHQQQRREAMRDGDREFLKPVKSMLELVRSHNPRSLHSLSNQAIMQPSYPHPHSSVMVNHTSSMNLNQNPVQSPHLNRATSHQELFRSSLSMVNLNLTQPHTSSFTHIATDPPNITQSQFNPTQVTQPLPQYTQGPPYLNHPQPNPSDVTQTIPSYNHSNWNTPRFVPSHNSIPYTEPYRPYQDPYNNQNQQNYHYPNQVNQGSSIEKIFSCRGFSPGNQYCACLGCGGTTPEVATSENPVQEGCNELGNQFQRVLPQRSQAVPEQSSPKPLEKSTFQADWASAPTKSFQESAIQITPQQQRTYSLGFSSESSHGGQTIPLLSLPDPFQSSQPLGSIEASQQEQFPAHTSGIVGSVRVGVNTVSDSQTCFKALRVVKVQKKIEKARKLRKNPKEKYKEQFSGSIEHDWFKEFVFVAPPAQKHVRKHNSHEMEEKLSMIGINTFDVEGIQLLSFNQEEIMSVEAANQEVKAANRWIRKLQREFKEKYKETITHPMFRVQHLRQQSHNIRMEITREMAYRLELPLLSLIHSHFQFRKSHIRSLSTDLTRFSTAHTSVRYGSSFLIPCGQGISKERALSRYISGDGGDVGGREEKGSGEKEETEMNGQSLSNNTMGFGPELSAKVGFGPKLPDDGPGAGESGPRLGESKLRRGTCARIARLAGPWIDRLASDVIGGYQQSCLPPQVQAIPATIRKFLRMFLGPINVRASRKDVQLKVKEEYNSYRDRTALLFLLFPSILLILRYRLWNGCLPAFPVQLYQAWLLFLYTGLALRENILRANGSDIRPWWIYHHYCAMIMALVSLTWGIKGEPNCAQKQRGVELFLQWAMMQGVAMLLQNRYQRQRLYTRIALGKAKRMDVVWGETAGVDGQLWLLCPILFVLQGFEAYVGLQLLRTAFVGVISEWQVIFCGILLVLMAVGNFMNTVQTLMVKSRFKAKMKRSKSKQEL